MDLEQKIRTLPARPGVYLYKNAEGEVIYVGKAKNLRSRVRSYLLAASQANAKTGSLMREAVDLDYILVDNEHEALALENNLIKQRKPRFNILLRDDKTYPYIKLTLKDRYPKVLVTRRLRKDGSRILRPLLPRQPRLPHRRADPPQLPAAQLQTRPLALLCPPLPAVLHQALSRPLRRRPDYSGDLPRSGARHTNVSGRAAGATSRTRSRQRMDSPPPPSSSSWQQNIATCIVTVEQLQEKQRIASAENDDADVFGYHYDRGMLAVNLFHMRAGKIVDRREFFWEELPEFPPEFLRRRARGE